MEHFNNNCYLGLMHFSSILHVNDLEPDQHIDEAYHSAWCADGLELMLGR